MPTPVNDADLSEIVCRIHLIAMYLANFKSFEIGWVTLAK